MEGFIFFSFNAGQAERDGSLFLSLLKIRIYCGICSCCIYFSLGFLLLGCVLQKKTYDKVLYSSSLLVSWNDLQKAISIDCHSYINSSKFKHVVANNNDG